MINNLDNLAPKQSYQFINCQEIQENIENSFFYVDFEKNYTRKDWLQGLQDRYEIGGNRIILGERHHLELLSRLGIKAKYGS